VRRAVVIGLRGLPDVRPETPGPYAELVTDPAAPPAFRSLTSSYAGVDSERCTRWVAFGPNSVPSCREITTYEQHRFVASAGLTLSPVSAANTDDTRGSMDLGREADHLHRKLHPQL
jgi:hypothetical protein